MPRPAQVVAQRLVDERHGGAAGVRDAQTRRRREDVWQQRPERLGRRAQGEGAAAATRAVRLLEDAAALRADLEELGDLEAVVGRDEGHGGSTYTVSPVRDVSWTMPSPIDFALALTGST